jgi:hypothetical protein
MQEEFFRKRGAALQRAKEVGDLLFSPPARGCPWKRHPSLCHPEQLTCLRQLEREMTPAIARDARPGGPTAKRQPSPAGLGHRFPNIVRAP